MPQGVLGPNWPPNYIPSSAEWQAALSAGAVARGIIQSTPCQLTTMTIFGIRTSIGPFNAILPPLATTMPGDWIMLFDVDYNAFANNVTFTATGPDNIAIYGSLQPTLVADVSDFMITFIANVGSWRANVRLA